MIKHPKISVVIPIYNVEDYIEETIQSVIAQTIGFLEHIEVILIDDGSPDNSAAIAKRYVDKFPDNMRYIKQKNSGVSTAKNNGAAYARGEFIHFLDSDDIISKNAYKKAVALLEDNQQIDFAALKIEFFDGSIGPHPLDYKFTGTDRVVDLAVEPNVPILHAATVIMRRSAIADLKFDARIKIAEDMKFNGELLVKKKAYGLVSSATYFYRKRSGGGSAIDTSREKKDFYQVTPYRVYEFLADTWTTDGTVHPYVQYAIMYDLQWRLQQKSQTVLSPEEEQAYKEQIRSLLRRIDDEVILQQKHLSTAYKLFALTQKYQTIDAIPKKIRDRLKTREASATPAVLIEFISQADDGSMVIEGRVPNGSPVTEIHAFINDTEVDMQDKHVALRNITFLGDMVFDGGVFSITLTKEQMQTVRTIRFTNQQGTPLHIVPKRQSRLPDGRGGYMARYHKLWFNAGTSLKVVPYSAARQAVMEVAYLLRIMAGVRLNDTLRRLARVLRARARFMVPLTQYAKIIVRPVIDLGRNSKDVAMRLLYHGYRPSRKLWIVSDRFLAAGDNGEALFDYIVQQDDVPARVYFAISKKSSDYARLREKYGKKVVNNEGLMYKFLFLRADKIISSHADDFVINPFNWRVKNFYNLFAFDFVFLQHGVIRNDLSPWLNRYNKNIRLFITSSQQEYDSILANEYYYQPKNVLLSGLPRFDLLRNQPKNKIILAPTWRHNLAPNAIDASGRRPYSDEFKDSEYYAFYQRLMNDESLRAAMRDKGITGEFYLHPSFAAQVDDFVGNEQFTIMPFPYSYRKAFDEGNLLITDYSSVFNDFVYLNKPIVMAQFDRDTFYSNQTIYTQGTDDRKVGFGPVTDTYDETIETIVSLIQRDFVMDDKYQKRISTFFAYQDRNNRKRVYEAIRGLDT